jgi:hypothetical protein
MGHYWSLWSLLVTIDQFWSLRLTIGHAGPKVAQIIGPVLAANIPERPLYVTIGHY